MRDAQAIETIQHHAHPLHGTEKDFVPLLRTIGDARFVLIGEASHGTHEFYATRAQITQMLIEKNGFTAVVAEADWPDAWRVNRYVRGFHDDDDADQALDGFKRFPQWMWRNVDVLNFVNWLRDHNEHASEKDRAGFYGMDLYSMYSSIDEVLRYLSKIDPEAASRAKERYSCFEDYGREPQAYGYAAGMDLGARCQEQVIGQLMELRRHRSEYAKRDGRVAEDEYFYAEQNARLVANAENYYRSMFGGRVSSWNLRDTHMVETIDALVQYLDRFTRQTKVVIWAHNSHLGDARATDSANEGQINVGQLVRERWPGQAYLIGFSGHEGTVTAASEWDAPAELKRVRPSLANSYERLFYETGLREFMLLIHDRELHKALSDPRLQRAIGVIYLPETERWSHYYHANLAEQFDAMIHYDVTHAVEPLERTALWEPHEVEETYPTGL